MKSDTLGWIGLTIIVLIVAIGLQAIEGIEQDGNWVGAFFAFVGLVAICWFLANSFDEAIDKKAKRDRHKDES